MVEGQACSSDEGAYFVSRLSRIFLTQKLKLFVSVTSTVAPYLRVSNRANNDVEDHVLTHSEGGIERKCLRALLPEGGSPELARCVSVLL